jgi:CRP/FNR family transcriptional regulator, dissimilatory nitrate respiration regulator
MSELTSLRELPLFASLDELTLNRLALDAKLENVEDGGVIFRQGDPATTFVVIVQGFVRLLRVAASGDETVIRILSNGESVTIAPMGASDLCCVSAEAVGPACVLKIPAGRFARLTRESLELADAVMRDAREKINALISEIESLKACNADQRLARFILALCPSGVETCRIRLPYDKRIIAARLGVTQETLSRAFAKMRDIGVRTEARDVCVESASRLVAFCENVGRSLRLPSECRVFDAGNVDVIH